MRRRQLRQLKSLKTRRKTRNSKMKSKHKEIRNVQIRKKELLGKQKLRRLLKP